jgi:hypothetical protein
VGAKADMRLLCFKHFFFSFFTLRDEWDSFVILKENKIT